MKYPLENYDMPAGDMLGVSNEISEDYGEISLKDGYLLVIMASE